MVFIINGDVKSEVERNLDDSMRIIDIRKDNFTAVHTLIEDTLFESKPALRIVKKIKSIFMMKIPMRK